MPRRRQAMLANERDDLVGCDQKCNCVDKPKQSQNEKPRQPIRISQREKTLNYILVVHLSRRRINLERRTPNETGNRHSTMENQENARGEIRTPDQGLM